MKKSLFLVFITLVLLLFSCADNNISYSDVPEDAWYQNALVALSRERNIIHGFDDGTLRPDDYFTYHQLIKCLVLIVEEDFKIKKTDDNWHKAYFDKAVELGIVTKKEAQKEDFPITRGESARFIVRALEHLKSKRFYPPKDSVIPYLSDYHLLDPAQAEDVLKCYGLGILNGYQDGSFKADNLLKRSETLVMLYRIIEPSQRINIAAEVEYGENTVKIAKVFHNSGQTFIVFDEVLTVDWKRQPTYQELFKEIEAFRGKHKVSYNIYQANHPIMSIDQLTPIRTIDSFSGWNTEIQGIHTKEKTDKALRYVCNEADGPLKPYQGVAVISATENEKVYYAITATVDGEEYKQITPTINTTSTVSEVLAEPAPVLQFIISDFKFYGNPNTDTYYYTRWEPAENSAIPDRPFDYLVAKSKKETDQAAIGLHLHGWDGSLTSGYGPWTRQSDNSIFVASNQYPYDWWTGYQEKHYLFDKSLEERTAEDYNDTVVRPFTTKRLLSFVDWMNQSDDWQFDIDKLYVVGSSMGGAGSAMMAIRHPEKIAWCKSDVGVHNPNNIQLKWSYEEVYGDPKFNPKFEDGTPVWDYYNDIWYLKQNIEKDIGLIVYSNGKNDEVIDWQQAVDFTNALQETKQPHVFWWGQDGHQQSTKLPGNLSKDDMLLNLKVNQSLPAFTNCSLDDDYGDGNPQVGDAAGQVNGYLTWNPDTIVDEADRWQIEVNLISEAPQQSCTVDITARKLQNFNLITGQELAYSIIRRGDQAVIKTGKVIVDNNGLFTVENVKVSKESCKLSVERVR